MLPAIALLILHATPAEALSEGLRYFEQAEFERAVPLLRDAIANGKTSKQARLALAQSCFYAKDLACAKGQIQKMVKAKMTVDLRLLPPDFAVFYDGVDKETAAAAPPPPPPPPPQAKAPRKKPVTAASTPTPDGKEPSTPEPARLTVNDDMPVPPPAPALAPWYLRIIPFGVGHFLQGDTIFGVMFLSIEVVFIGANVGFAIVNETSVLSNGRLPAGPRSTALYWAQQGTAIATYVVFAAALIDAVWLSPGRRNQPVTVLPTGNGLVLTGWF